MGSYGDSSNQLWATRKWGQIDPPFELELCP